MRVGIRVSVALAVILPLLFLLGGGWVTTFAIALVGFGAGRLVERLVFGPGPHEVAGGQALWPLVVFPLLGLVVLAGVELVEYQQAQRSEDALEELRRSQEQTRQAVEPAAPQEIVWRVQVLADGGVLSDGRPAQIEALRAPEGASRAEVSAGPQVSYEQVLAVMDRIRSAGVEDIGMASP
jgi:hypothetical protein